MPLPLLGTGHRLGSTLLQLELLVCCDRFERIEQLVMRGSHLLTRHQIRLPEMGLLLVTGDVEHQGLQLLLAFPELRHVPHRGFVSRVHDRLLDVLKGRLQGVPHMKKDGSWFLAVNGAYYGWHRRRSHGCSGELWQGRSVDCHRRGSCDSFRRHCRRTKGFGSHRSGITSAPDEGWAGPGEGLCGCLAMLESQPVGVPNPSGLVVRGRGESGWDPLGSLASTRVPPVGDCGPTSNEPPTGAVHQTQGSEDSGARLPVSLGGDRTDELLAPLGRSSVKKQERRGGWKNRTCTWAPRRATVTPRPPWPPTPSSARTRGRRETTGGST